MSTNTKSGIDDKIDEPKLWQGELKLGQRLFSGHVRERRSTQYLCTSDEMCCGENKKKRKTQLRKSVNKKKNNVTSDLVPRYNDVCK